MTTSKPRDADATLPEEPPEATNSAAEKPPHKWGIGAFLLVEAILLISAIFIGVLLKPEASGQLTAWNVLIGTMAPMVIAALVAILITAVRGNGPLIDLRLSLSWDEVKTGLKFGALGIALIIPGSFIWSKAVGEDQASSAISALIDNQPMSVAAAISMFLYLWLLGPICEEIIFRGLLWGSIERLQWNKEVHGRLAAFVISTAIFALSHLEPLRTSLLLLASIPIGLARFTTGRLTPSIVAHQISNFLPALAILLTALGVLAA